MSDNKQSNRNKWFVYGGILVVLLFMVLRFVLYYFKSDGFSGISVWIPVLLMGTLVFSVSTAICFAAWVYQDCKKRNDDGILWAVVVFIATPFIGLLVYFLRRSEVKQICWICGHKISLRAKFCEECGSPVENKEDINIMEKQHTHHIKYIVTGVVCMVLMLTCLSGFIIKAASSHNVNTAVTSNEKVWNMGVITMNYETHIDGVWKLDFKKASDGFVAEQSMKIKNHDEEKLYADISCATVPEGSSLTLWLVQGEAVKSIDVTNLSKPLEYSLSGFANDTIHVRLQINGVEDAASEIYIK